MILSGKKGLVLGVANRYSIATAIAESLTKEGAVVGFNYLPDQPGKDRMRKRVERSLSHLNPAMLAPCDVADDRSIDEFFREVQIQMGQVDFLIHSIAYAPREDIRCKTVEASRKGFSTAMDVSVYSFIRVANSVRPLMPEGGSIITISYYGGEKVVPGYNLMGVCKSALETATRYLAYDLGREKIRVNAVSAGPIKTLAASAISDFNKMLAMNEQVAPLGKNITGEDVGKMTAYLVSDSATVVTGEVLHVDGGFHIMSGGLYQQKENP